MATDIQFVQKYNEVLLENFNAVLKQNFMFQTQIALSGDEAKKHEDYEIIKSEVAKLIQENTNLRNEITAKNNEINSKNAIIQTNTNTDGDRHRLQTALNKQSKDISLLEAKKSELEKTLEKNKEEFKIILSTREEEMQKVIDEQSQYIKQIEDMLPNSKKKKLGIAVVEEKVVTVQEEVKEETPEIVNDDVVKVESAGGNF